MQSTADPMFGDGSLTFREFVTGEPHPLATIHDAVLKFLRGRSDAVLFGAQAVNAYVDKPRMTQDVDIMSTRAAEFADELRAHLIGQFQIALRIREVKAGTGYRIFQIRHPKNRHLVVVRGVSTLPVCNSIDGVLVPLPAELICMKILSMSSRGNTAKGLMDGADLRRLLLGFPELKSTEGAVSDALLAARAPNVALNAWQDLAGQEILEDDDAAY